MLRSIGLGIKSFSELVRSSSLLFFASIFANICNLLFWLFMVRRLDAVDFGILNALLSLFMILSLPASSAQMVVTKFVSEFSSSGELAKIKYFILHFAKRLLVADFIFLASFVLVSRNIAHFLQIEIPALIVITGFGLFVTMLMILPTGTLQGLQKFTTMAFNSVLNGALRLILGILLVLAGSKIFGAIWGFVLAGIISLVVVVLCIPKKIFKAGVCHISELKLPRVYYYFLPVSISMLCYMILTNIDVVLVKHFFDPVSAGTYSVAQTIGRIILFLPGAVGVVLFPKMTEASTKKTKVSSLLIKGMCLAGVLCIMADIICFVYPSFVLHIVTKKVCIECIPLIKIFCISMTFYALIQILITYYLSIHSSRYIPYLVGATILQILLITLFHNELIHILIALLATSTLLFFAGLINIAWEQ